MNDKSTPRKATQKKVTLTHSTGIFINGSHNTIQHPPVGWPGADEELQALRDVLDAQNRLIRVYQKRHILP